MYQLPRRLTQLLLGLSTAVFVASCGDRATAPDVSTLSPTGPSLSYIPPYPGCQSTTTCGIPAPLADPARIEQLRVCKSYPGGTGPAITVRVRAVSLNPITGPTDFEATVQPNSCIIIWQNGEFGLNTDTVYVSEVVPAGYVATSQVSTVARVGDRGPAATFPIINNPETSQTSEVKGIVGGPRTPGIKVTFVNRVNEDPHVILNGPYVNVEGSTVTFSSAGTDDPEGDPLTYFWTFGDGGTSTLPNPTHTYADNGVYPVTVTVNDGNGPITANTTATITNLAPVPTLLTSTPSVSCGQTGYVTATFTDPGVIDNQWTYDIDWGDGSAHSTGNATTQAGAISGSHLYAANGTYTVVIVVTDKDGATGTSSTAIKRDCTPPPTAPSCTYTQGYWKNHESAWPSPYSPNAQWLSATYNVTGVTWDGLMGMAPRGGNSYIQLAHQWIAAKLNVGSASSSGSPAVDAVLNAAEAWLKANTPANSAAVPNIKNNQATAWATTLDDYNNGRLGLPHCN